MKDISENEERSQCEEREAREFIGLPDFKCLANLVNERIFSPLLIVVMIAAVFLLGIGSNLFTQLLSEKIELPVYVRFAASIFPPVIFILFYSSRFERVNSTVLALLIYAEARIFARRRRLEGASFFARVRVEYPATFAASYWRRRAIGGDRRAGAAEL